MLRMLLVLTLAPMLALLAWMAGDRDEARADLVIASDALRTIDPQRVSWLDEIQTAQALFEGLTRLNPQTFQPEPAVAQAWEIEPDGPAYTFYLRPDARWSNGEPVVAEHFRFAWLRALDPQVESQYASLLFVIAGAETYYRSRLDRDPANDAPADTVGIDVREPHVLHVRLARPCSYFFDLTSFPTFAPLHPPTLERWAYRDGRVLRREDHVWTRPEHIVCNGAFTLDRWDFKRRMLLRPNPYYWQRDAIALGSIELFVSGDAAASLVGYQTGRIDLVAGLEPEIALALHQQQQAGRRSDFHLSDRFATFFFRVNCRRPPLDNADLRKALALAIDKQAICRNVLGLGETPADTFVPRGALDQMPRTAPDGQTVYYVPPDGLGHGLTYAQRQRLAREYLARSGLDAGALRPIELAFAPEPIIQRRIAEAVQQMWQATLGISVELLVLERTVLSERIAKLDYDVVRSDWYGDYMDPATFLDMFTSASGQNRTGWAHPEYDRLIAAAAQAADNRARFALFREAERLLCEQELPILPVYFKRGAFLLREDVRGLRDSLRDVLPIHRARREDGSAFTRAPG